MRWLGLFTNKIFRKHLKLIFPHRDFIICIVSLAIFHPHFLIRIFPSAFCHPQFSIRILSSAFFYPPSAIRRHPVRTLQRPLGRCTLNWVRNPSQTNYFSLICFCSPDSLTVFGRYRRLTERHSDNVWIPYKERKTLIPKFSSKNAVFKVAEHSFSARFCWCNLAPAQGFRKTIKHAVNRAIILFTQHPHYLCYFTL